MTITIIFSENGIKTVRKEKSYVVRNNTYNGISLYINIAYVFEKDRFLLALKYCIYEKRKPLKQNKLLDDFSFTTIRKPYK
jgi:hypothetical protein